MPKKKEPKMVTKKSIAEGLVTEFEMTQKDAKAVVDYVFDEITEAITTEGEANILGFGKFSTVKTKARTARNPFNGETIKVPAGVSPKFKFSTAIKNAFKK